MTFNPPNTSSVWVLNCRNKVCQIQYSLLDTIVYVRNLAYVIRTIFHLEIFLKFTPTLQHYLRRFAVIKFNVWKRNSNFFILCGSASTKKKKACSAAFTDHAYLRAEIPASFKCMYFAFSFFCIYIEKDITLTSANTYA